LEIKDYLKEEMKRLNRRNDLLEKNLNQSNIVKIDIEEQIKNNVLAMCEITKTLNIKLLI